MLNSKVLSCFSGVIMSIRSFFLIKVKKVHVSQTSWVLKLLELAAYFNLCPINLLGLCYRPTDIFISHCGGYRSTIDYIFVPNCLFNGIYSAKTFDLSVENMSDHLPIMIKLNQPKIPDCAKILTEEYLTG